MMAKRLFAALMLAAAFLVPFANPRPAAAQMQMRVAAIVNDDVISLLDVAARVQMIVATSSMPDNNEVRRRLAPQVLRALIDEKIQLQEAERLGMSVTTEEIDAAVADLERRNNVPPGQLEAFLRAHNVMPETIRTRLKAELAWQKVVARRLRPRVVVGDDEIDAVLQRIRENAGRTEYRLAEIVLSVPTPDREAEIADAARRLAEQARDGADFAALARAFSDGVTANQGGDVGWVLPGQMAPEIDAFITSAERGAVSDPIRAKDGYHVIRLTDSRRIIGADTASSQVSLKQVFLPVTARADDEDVAARMQQLASLADSVKSCTDLDTAAAKLDDATTTDLGTVAVSDLSPTLRDSVADLDAGQMTAPARTDDGVQVLMVCSRKDAKPTMPSRETIRANLEGQRLEMLAQRYLQDLRRQAFIDVRI